MTTLSLVVPCYNEEETIRPFFEETNKVLKEMNLEHDTEFIFVDDGSKDKTLEILKELSGKEPTIHYISFSRNFGKEAALYAGLNKAKGKYIAIMDADLQDPPALLPQMKEAIEKEAFDCAATRRVDRKNEPPIRSFFARLFYKIMAKASNIEVVDGARDFRLMTRKYVDAVLSLTEKNRFTKGIFPWVGFKTKWFEYENIERVAGATKWSFWTLFLYSIDGIIGFSTKPLAFSAISGIFSMLLSLIIIIGLIIRKLMCVDCAIEGWASTICIILFLAGLQLFAIGIIGIYLSKIYIEIKQRPIYIISEEN